MSIFRQLRKVRAAQSRMRDARQELSHSSAALLVRGYQNPLTTMSAAAGAGFVLGRLNVHPMRVPGVNSLLSGGLADAISYGTRLIAELGAAGTEARGEVAEALDDAARPGTAADGGDSP